MTKEIQINKFRFPPEIAIQTDAEDFLSGGKSLVRLKTLNRAQQMVMPLGYSVDAVDNILINHIFDSFEAPSLDSGSLKGNAAADQEIDDSPYAFIFDEYRLNAQNNTGGTSSDYRSRLRYAIMPNTVVRKLANRITLTPRDVEAVSSLKQAGIVDVTKVFDIGFRQPMNFTEGLNDRNKEGIQRALTPGITLGTTRTQLMKFDVEKGDCAVLKTLVLQKPVQAQVGEATISISRDDDEDLIQFDPAAIQGSTANIELHIPAYNEIKVELESNSANQANYKAFAALQIKVVGLWTKARLLEFSEDSFPIELTVSEAEQREIDSLMLKELNRAGLML